MEKGSVIIVVKMMTNDVPYHGQRHNVYFMKLFHFSTACAAGTEPNKYLNSH